MIEDNQWLGEVQNGFRGKRSAMDNLFILTNIIALAKTKKSKLFLGFIDLRKAYDTVDRDKLWHKLKNLGLNEEVIQLLQQLYKFHRRKCKTVGGWTAWVECNIGVKEGCVLSPLLFALFIRDILSEVKGGLGNKWRKDTRAAFCG